MYDQALIAGFISAALSLVGWIGAVALAAIILRRGEGRAEHFFLAGTSLMLVRSLMGIPATALSSWLIISRGMTFLASAPVLSIFSLIRGCIGLAGIICLVYAFWIRFKARSTAGLTPKELK